MVLYLKYGDVLVIHLWCLNVSMTIFYSRVVGVPMHSSSILVCNHQSIFDFLIVFAYTACVPYVPIEANNVPLIGRFLQVTFYLL